MDGSTIYVKCPQCKENGLLTEMQGRHFCANGMFNYTPLKDDRVRLDDVLVATIRGGGFGTLFASALYQKLTLTASPDTHQYIQQLAQKHHVDLMPGKGFVSKIVNLMLGGPFRLLRMG